MAGGRNHVRTQQQCSASTPQPRLGFGRGPALPRLLPKAGGAQQLPTARLPPSPAWGGGGPSAPGPAPTRGFILSSAPMCFPHRRSYAQTHTHTYTPPSSWPAGRQGTLPALLRGRYPTAPRRGGRGRITPACPPRRVGTA